MRFSTGGFTTHKHRWRYYVRTCTNRRHRGCSCGSCRPCCRRRRRKRCDSGRSLSSPGCGVTSCASSSSCDDAPRSDTADTLAASHLRMRKSWIVYNFILADLAHTCVAGFVYWYRNYTTICTTCVWRGILGYVSGYARAFIPFTYMNVSDLTVKRNQYVTNLYALWCVLSEAVIP